MTTLDSNAVAREMRDLLVRKGNDRDNLNRLAISEARLTDWAARLESTLPPVGLSGEEREAVDRIYAMLNSVRCADYWQGTGSTGADPEQDADTLAAALRRLASQSSQAPGAAGVNNCPKHAHLQEWCNCSRCTAHRAETTNAHPPTAPEVTGEDRKALESLAASMQFGRTHDALRRILAALNAGAQHER
jgi:hypothetical protein